MKALLFGGTSEGRKLAKLLAGAGADLTLSVATEFGRGVMETSPGVNVLAQRLDEDGIHALLKESAFDCVIDATHPYAAEATRNIRAACLSAGVAYYRLIRPQGEPASGVTYVPDAQAAAEALRETGESALLAIGSKGLEPFTRVENFARRFFVRILPMPESLQKAVDLGFRGSNIICMQGPFDEEMNMALLRATGADVLVTKDSGGAGGFDSKIAAALKLGRRAVVISRPAEEDGYTFDELLERLNIKETPIKEAPEPERFFPLFIDMRGKSVLVCGGGNVAERRIMALRAFGADIAVISPDVTARIKRLAAEGAVRWIQRKYRQGDIAERKPFLVIAATDERAANHAAMLEAKNLGIPASVADCREECSMVFPAVIEGETLVAGLVSKNGDHKLVKRTAQKIRELLGE